MNDLLPDEWRVDGICLRFEDAWKAGKAPRIDDFLKEATGAESVALLKELVLLDVSYRRKRGETVQSAEYLARFPELDLTWLDSEIQPTPPNGGKPGEVVKPPADAVLPVVPGYEILRPLGRGGMAVVYEARHIQLNRRVALKTIRADKVDDPGYLARFKTEAEAVARFQHANIVQIYEVSEHDGMHFFSMELCGGGSLEEKPGGMPLPPREAAGLLETLARAVHAAHGKGVVHRDLKPGNVLFGDDGTPKISDFGLAKKLDVEQGPTVSDVVLGSPYYMAPEQARGKSMEAGPAADVYALGAILYECLTGRPPFKAANIFDTLAQVLTEDPVPVRRLQPKVARDLETICLKCLQKEPGKRYATAAELAEDLRRFQAGEPIRARPVGVMERVLRWGKRNPSWAALAAAVIVATAGAASAAAWYQQDRAARTREQDQRRARATRDVLVAVAKGEEMRDRVRGLSTDTIEGANAALAGWKEGSVAIDAAVDSARTNDADPGVRAAAEEVKSEFDAGVKGTDARIQELRREATFAVGLRRATMLGWARTIDFSIDYSLANEAYAAAFRELGVDVRSLDPAAAAEQLEKESARIRELAAQGLDDWRLKDEPNRARLRQVVDRLDKDLWRQEFRTALDQRDITGLKKLAQAKDVSPRQAEWLGVALRAFGGVEDSRALLKRSVLQFPSDLGLRIELGNCLASDPRPDYYAAAACGEAATAISPCAIAYSNLAFYRKNCGQIAEAEDDVHRALELEPESVNALSNLAAIKILRFDTPGVDAAANQILALHPQLPEGIAYKAWVLVCSGQPGAAIKMLDGLPAAAQKGQQPILARAFALAASGDLDTAATIFAELARRYPNSDKGALASTLVPLLRGDSKAAEMNARALVQRFHEGSWAMYGHLLLSASLLLQGRLTEAEAEDRNALQFQKDFAPNQMLLDAIFLHQGRFPEAQALADQMAKSKQGTFLGMGLAMQGWAIGQFVSAGDRVDRIAAGKEQPSNWNWVLDAEAALLKHRPALALRIYRNALIPGLFYMGGVPSTILQNEGMTHQANAAHAAALVAAGEGLDAAGATDEERRHARADALQWLQCELKNKELQVEGGGPMSKVRRFLIYLQTCPDFAAIRDSAALAKLPDAEQKDWTQFWADVDAVLKKAQAK